MVARGCHCKQKKEVHALVHLENEEPLQMDEEEADEEEDEEGNRVVYVDQFRAPPGKMIGVPVRVEPKVVFAAESTFPHWSRLAILLGGVSINPCQLTQFRRPRRRHFRPCFAFTALLALAYSGGVYTYRIVKLPRKCRAIGCHDLCGPTVLCLALVGRVMVILVRRLREL